jgi:hypothetical protein
VTTIAAPATAWDALEAALRQRRPVHVSYHATQRLVCPHTLGWNNGRPLLLGYQTGGQTSTGPLPADPRRRWRCLFVDEVDNVVAADDDSAWGTADNYNPAHPFPAVNEITMPSPQMARDTPLR